MKKEKTSYAPLVFLLLLLISEPLANYFQYFNYCDEIVTVIFGLYIIAKILCGHKPDKLNSILLFLMIALILLGLTGNIISRAQHSMTAIIIDAIANVKVVACFIAMRMMFEKRGSAELCVRMLALPAKIMIVVGMCFAILSLFNNYGMSVGEERFGLKPFSFVYGYAHIYAISLLFFLIIIELSGVSKKSFYIFLLMTMAQMLLTTKGPWIVWVAVVALLLFYYKRFSKLSIWWLVIIGILALILGQYQIQTYFLNQSSPRYILIKFGFRTVRTYPFGSGFATYGSDASGTYYSDLYYLYGFDKMSGLSPNDTRFLNDNFWPKILGQFGFPGLIIITMIMVILFISFNRSKMNGILKALVVSAFLACIIHSLGSSTFNISCCVSLFAGYALAMRLPNGVKNATQNIVKENCMKEVSYGQI